MGTSPPSKKGRGAKPTPNFWPMSIVTKRLDGSRCYLAGRQTLARRHCVRWEPSFPSPKGQSPQFSAHVCCGQTDGWIKTPLGTEAGLGAGHIVSDGDPAPCQRGTASQFSAHVCSGQMAAGWMKMPLGTKVGLGSGDIVLDGDSAPLNKGHSSDSTHHLSAHVYCGQTPGCTKMPLRMVQR